MAGFSGCFARVLSDDVTNRVPYSEFPSLSNNPPQQPLTSSQSSWATSGSRNTVPSASLRLQQSSTQQLGAQQQDDLFTSSSQMSSGQGSFRFGNQTSIGQSAQSTSADEFPPLNRNTLGEIGQDRTSIMIQNVGFGSQSNGVGFGPTTHPQQNRSNGLLNALSGSSRLASSNRVSSPTSISGREHSTFPSQGVLTRFKVCPIQGLP